MTHKNYIRTGQCIWCAKKYPSTKFNTKPHIIPNSLGADEIGVDVCDECNHEFGTTHIINKPCVDLCVKEIFQAYKIFCRNVNENTYKSFKSIFFSYRHEQQTIIINKKFNSRIITRQFKRGLYELFLQKYHLVTGDGNNSMFDMIRKFARYDYGNPRVLYTYNNIVFLPDEKQMLTLHISKKEIEIIQNTGVFPLTLLGQTFYLEIFPTIFITKGLEFIQEEAKTMLLPVKGNERIFEFSDIMQIDFFMQRFNSGNRASLY